MKSLHNIDILSKLINFILNHIILILSIFFCIGVGLALFNMSALSSRLIEAQALQFAESEAQSITAANKLYSSEVVSRAKSVDGISVTHNYPVLKG
jgi:adenylate cyclase